MLIVSSDEGVRLAQHGQSVNKARLLPLKNEGGGSALQLVGSLALQREVLPAGILERSNSLSRGIDVAAARVLHQVLVPGCDLGLERLEDVIDPRRDSLR